MLHCQQLEISKYCLQDRMEKRDHLHFWKNNVTPWYYNVFDILPNSAIYSFSDNHTCSFFPQGTARRKKKVVHKTATADDKKLQGSLKKLAVNNIAGIEEVSHQRNTNVVLFDCSCTALSWWESWWEEIKDSESLMTAFSCHLVYF